MGLVFALQPDARRSAPDHLVIRSSKRRFSLGGGFLFGGALLGTMFLAAQPLFKIFWTQGGLFDRIITLGVVVPIGLYPLLALVCWFFEEKIEVSRRADGTLDIKADEGLPGVRWKRRELHGVALSNLAVENWTGAKNVAAISAEARGGTDRYGTRGHWLLKVRTSPTEAVLLERRAKRDDIELLKAQIEVFFGAKPVAPTT